MPEQLLLPNPNVPSLSILMTVRVMRATTDLLLEKSAKAGESAIWTLDAVLLVREDEHRRG